MGRETFNLFFDPCAVLCVTDRINRIIQDNRKLNIMVESIGVFRHTLTLAKNEIDFSGEDNICIRAGSMIIRISADNPNTLGEILESDHVLNYHSVSIFFNGSFPNDVFIDDCMDDEHIFLKKVKGKAITSGHLAEMEKAVIGVMQDTGHTVGEDGTTNIARVDAVIAYFLLPGNYVAAIDDADVLALRDVEAFPGLRLTKIDSQISIHIPPCITDDDCIVCYILDNYEAWVLKFEAYSKLIELIDDIDVSGTNINVKLKLDNKVVFEKEEATENGIEPEE